MGILIEEINWRKALRRRSEENKIKYTWVCVGGLLSNVFSAKL